MHRSGTSLVARVLNLVGVDLGSEEGLLESAPDNPAGYWESSDILDINEAIFTTFGGRWDNLPEMPDGWLASSKLAPLRKRARDVMRERFGESKLWGWKDPRNSITLPFWQEIVRGMHYVICIRNPVDVAESLSARGDGRSGREHVEDWLRHTALALHHTASRPRIVIHYESFFENPEDQVERLARFLGRKPALKEPGVMEEILDFIDPELVHGRTSPVIAMDDPRVPATAAALYMSIRLASEVDSLRKVGRDAAPESWAAVNKLALHLLEDLDDSRRRERRIKEADRRLQDIEAEIKKRGRRVQQLARMVEERDRKLADARRDGAKSKAKPAARPAAKPRASNRGAAPKPKRDESPKRNESPKSEASKSETSPAPEAARTAEPAGE
jgi:hypothetical protein